MKRLTLSIVIILISFCVIAQSKSGNLHPCFGICSGGSMSSAEFKNIDKLEIFMDSSVCTNCKITKYTFIKKSKTSDAISADITDLGGYLPEKYRNVIKGDLIMFTNIYVRIEGEGEKRLRNNLKFTIVK